MFTDDITGEMREQSEATGSGDASSRSERRDIPEQPDERPSSIYLQHSVIRKGRRSSVSSLAGSGSDANTPDPEIENSLAYTCTSKSGRGSLKRTKRSLPPDEPNEVHERITVGVDHPGQFRNKLLTAAVNDAEEEKKLLRDHTPDSMKMNDSNSTVSSVDSTSMPEMETFDQDNAGEKNALVVNSRQPTPCKQQSFMEDKTVKSESYLLTSNLQPADSFVLRAQSAPVEVASICTQTEWSWIEDMRRCEQMKSELIPTQKIADDTVQNGRYFF